LARSSAVLLLVFGWCGEPSWIELQIADRSSPFLEATRDYDALVVSTRKTGCARVDADLAPAPLPATLTVEPGDCYVDDVELRVEAQLGGASVARSSWLTAAFAPGGAVVTATLADVPVPRALVDLELSPRELPVVVRRSTTIDTAAVVDGQAQLVGTATAAGAFTLVRLVTANVVIQPGDALVATVVIGAGATIAELGFELELNTGASAQELGLVDRDRRRADPAATAGRGPGTEQQWTIDLSAAAGARLVGVLFGVDARGSGATGQIDAGVKQLTIVR